ncbi:UNVERIFIED_CONTAM: RING-H2 finger protein ATL5 [Sesamum radiatum]|uniref:RING-H2 finger protein ATL5 n=1 Tax=Sesamum radiatum TaxID=300843 RepID=A0AAW2KRK9_SESRA
MAGLGPTIGSSANIMIPWEVITGKGTIDDLWSACVVTIALVIVGILGLCCAVFRGFELLVAFFSEAAVPKNRTNGLEPVVVAAIPTMKFDREAFSSTEDAQCSICLAEYQEKEVLRIMPNCGHSFHLSCIDTWLRKRSTCPVCRLSIQDAAETTKHVRAATLMASHLFDNSETMFEHSQQWLLPTSERAEGNGRARTATLTTTQSFDSSGTAFEHSQQWLLPTSERAERNGMDQTHTDSISIVADSGVSGEGRFSS